MEMPKEVWCAENGNQGSLIVCDSKIHAQIGAYKDMARGKEVINEIFQYYRNGKNSYIMPIE